MNEAISGLIGIAPKDELEGMLTVQLIASHSAAMECYQRAMLPEQTFERRQAALGQAGKLSRTHVLLALNRPRGKGQQKVTVETSTSVPAAAPVARDEERSLPDARREVARTADGE
jgi:hypothetical protein